MSVLAMKSQSHDGGGPCSYELTYKDHIDKSTSFYQKHLFSTAQSSNISERVPHESPLVVSPISDIYLRIHYNVSFHKFTIAHRLEFTHITSKSWLALSHAFSYICYITHYIVPLLKYNKINKIIRTLFPHKKYTQKKFCLIKFLSFQYGPPHLQIECNVFFNIIYRY